MKWEYCRADAQDMHGLNLLGADGWQAIGMYTVGGYSGPPYSMPARHEVLLMRKRIEEPV